MYLYMNSPTMNNPTMNSYVVRLLCYNVLLAGALGLEHHAYVVRFNPVDP